MAHFSYPSYVYFVEAPTEDLLKIGVSGDPFSRVSHLASRYKWRLHLIGAVPGDHREERRVHANFKASGACVFGEWYRYSRVRGDVEYLLPPPDLRIPKKMTREEIVWLAMLRPGAPVSQIERDEAFARLRERGRWDESVRDAFLEKLYGPKRRP